MENKINLSFLSKSANEGFARAAVSAFVAQLDPTLEELADIKTAVSEAVTNAIVHGYGHGNGIVTISCALSLDKTVCLTISDAGRGIENIEQALEPMYTSAADDERSGMGFTVMETFMDSLVVQSEMDKGTTVIMTKQIGSDSTLS
ncbi:MAG: anti-sigma F factor [Clostridia bacterium]|nr:anti-sigma F factor [Clostridia bacterium]